jgi:hypothetical protein
MNLSVAITENTTAVLNRLETRLTDSRVSDSVGRSVMELIQNHFRALPPNERGFPSTQFWQRAADATRYEVTADGVQISINQVGIRQRLLGGPIDPVRGKYLTIPAIAETYGHTASDFGNLKVFYVRSDFGYELALAPADTIRQPGGLIDSSAVYFWLVAHVNQFPDPSVLPTDEEIFDVAMEAADNFFERLTASGANN